MSDDLSFIFSPYRTSLLNGVCKCTINGDGDIDLLKGPKNLKEYGVLPEKVCSCPKSKFSTDFTIQFL